MHEASIAVSLLDQLVDLASENNLRQITRVRVDLGISRLVVPEALELAFAAASQNTVAENALLEMREVGIDARCRSCGFEYPAAVDDYTCPSCGQAKADIIAGNDILLVSLEGERGWI